MGHRIKSNEVLKRVAHTRSLRQSAVRRRAQLVIRHSGLLEHNCRGICDCRKRYRMNTFAFYWNWYWEMWDAGVIQRRRGRQRDVKNDCQPNSELITETESVCYCVVIHPWVWGQWRWRYAIFVVRYTCGKHYAYTAFNSPSWWGQYSLGLDGPKQSDKASTWSGFKLRKPRFEVDHCATKTTAFVLHKITFFIN